MCRLIESVGHLQEGWGCCHCPDNAPGFLTYNGIHRDTCKCCGKPPCEEVLSKLEGADEV